MTVKHGRKTEEREHVFNKSFFKNSKGAQDVKILCLSFMMLSVVLPLSAKAQPTPLYARPNAPAVSDDVVARMEIRLQEMERQLRDLTGRVEEQNFEISKLKSQNKILEQQAVTPKQAPQSATQSAHQSAPQSATQSVIAERANPLKLTLTPPTPTGMKTAVPGGGPVQVTSQYEQAFTSLKNNQYDTSRKEFEMFLSENPDHSLAPNAKYWIGESYYAQGDFKTAARSFAEGFQKFPTSAKSPDILLKLGMSLAQMGNKGDACVALSQLPVKFPAGPEGVLQRGKMEREKLACDT